MIVGTIVYKTMICDVCEEPLLVKAAFGPPPVCPYCGASGTEPTDPKLAARLVEKKNAARQAAMGGGRQRIIINGVEVNPSMMRGGGPF